METLNTDQAGSLSCSGGGEIVWRPPPELVAHSNLRRFMRAHGLASLADLQQRSVTNIEWFWDAVLSDLDIRFRRPYSRIVNLSRGVAWPEWCVGGVMNIVDNCLDKYEVNRMTNVLIGLGLGKGDAIGVFMPMTPEIVVAMLAIIKIGGVFLPLFSGFGPQAIVSRLADAQAKALFTADGCWRRGKTMLLKPVADEAADRVPSLRHLIVHRRIGTEPPWNPRRDLWWHEVMAAARDKAAAEPTFAEDPLMILYTSGTTGRPKGSVHTHCGFPVKAAQDISQGFDLHPDETLFWVTDMGWMMGPWLVFGTLLLGASMMLYDGAPDWPGPDRLWSLVERRKITTFGISPTLVRSLLRHGDEPVRLHDLSALRKFGSTGEPWNSGPWLWLFNHAGAGRLPIINYSGGTETSGGILCGNVLSPLKPCSFAGPLPGMAADIADTEGRSVRGQVGELLIRQPWIGMTRGFWRDPQRYLDTYWSRFPGVWVHGDWATVDGDGFWYILGRSDDTIKIAGKRVGPAEVESVLVGHAAVTEAAVIGVPDELKGEALACFCVLKPGQAGNDALHEELKSLVAAALGKPLTPRTVEFLRELPRTRNGKIMRRVVRSAYLGKNLGDLSSLENPSSVEEIKRAAVR